MIVTIVMHECQNSLLAFDLFIQTLNFNNKNREPLEGDVTTLKEKILHSTTNI